jgi:transposase
MYIRKTTKIVKGRTYTNYLLVESVLTDKGPRQKTVFSSGNLKPRPREEWMRLAEQLKDALAGQKRIGGFDKEVEEILSRRQETSHGRRRSSKTGEQTEDEIVSIRPDKMEFERCRQAGSVHVGHQFWKRLGMDQVLEAVGFNKKTQTLTELMTLNRLVCPSSEHAMPNWLRRTAVEDILGMEFENLNDETLYRNMDRLYPARGEIEKALGEREKSLFNLADTIYLYDLTSTYFEGQALRNPQAKRGYSRDGRPDCKQVIVGLVIGREGFPKAHEVFDGNRADQTTVKEILDVLQARSRNIGEGTVVIDRGMAGAENIRAIKERGMHYIVAGRHSERNEWLKELETDGWEEVKREPSPTNPFQKKARVYVKRAGKGDETVALCKSEGREEKDRAIREKQEKRLLADIERLKGRIGKGRLKDEKMIEQAIGRLKERYPRVARYYGLSYDAGGRRLCCEEKAERKTLAEKLDGSYILKTDKTDLAADEIWRTYSMLTRAEKAFRDMKSPLAERPVFHQLKHRVQTHIFLCVLAYHLLVAIEKTLSDKKIYASWSRVRMALETHEVITVVLLATNGEILKVRRCSRPEQEHLELYRALGVPCEIVKPKKTWVRA